MPSTRACLASIRPRLEDSKRMFSTCNDYHDTHDTDYRKQETGFVGARTPFDCCALSFQPFETPVCARNADGTGLVFELTNIIPWLKYVPSSI